MRQAFQSFAVAVAVLGHGAIGMPSEARAQITIDQSVLDRLGPPRREPPPPPAGPSATGLPLAPADGQLVARPEYREGRPAPRRASRPRRAAPPAPSGIATPAILPETGAEGSTAPDAAPSALALPVPPDFVPPPPLPAPPVPPMPPGQATVSPVNPPAPPPVAAAAAPPVAPAASAGPPGATPPPPPSLAPAATAAARTPAGSPPSNAPAAAAPPQAASTVAATPAAQARAPQGAASGSASPGPVRLAFRPGDSTLAADGRARLAALVRELPPDDGGTRIVIVGYGDDPEGDSSRARRLALARAIEARGVLLANGVRSTRIDVRAMGRPTDGSDPDRVDVGIGGAPIGLAR